MATEQAFTQKSKYEWEWQRGNKHYAVRYFPQTKRLIWSGWMKTSDSPVFEEGYTQTVDDFLANGIDGRNPPPELIEALQTAMREIQENENRGGVFGWLRRLGR